MLCLQHQVASQPDATVDRLQEELLRWEEQYQASTAAAGPAKWRLRSAFLSGTYASLLRSVQERRSAEERARASEVSRHTREVRFSGTDIMAVSDIGGTLRSSIAPSRRNGSFWCVLSGHWRSSLVSAVSMCMLTMVHCVQLEARAAAARQAAEEAEQKRLHVEQQLHSFKPQVSPYHPYRPALV